ncbi:hypothetical protein ACFQE1_17555, partial [Halobium palmae]
MQRPAALLLVFLAVSLPLSAAGVFAGSPSNAEQTSSQRDAVQQTSFDRNRVVLTVHENGSTKWTFHYRRTLNNASERRDFRSFSDEFNSNETSLYRGFKSNAETLTSEGQNVTGREMNARSFSRRAYVSNTTFGQPVGAVEMSFVWTRFAVVRGERVIVGDVFEGGLYLRPGLTLVVSPDPGLAFDSVDPAGTPSNASSLRGSDSVTWQGEKEFTDNRPRVVFVPPEAASRSSTPSRGTGGNGS